MTFLLLLCQEVLQYNIWMEFPGYIQVSNSRDSFKYFQTVDLKDGIDFGGNNSNDRRES